MAEKILFVDDEINVLQAYKRILRKKFELDTALGGAEGLELVNKKGPYAVIISDYQMPEMNGVQFLAQARKQAPDTVRMMLTGNADLGSAIEAVNEGHIFRFMTKPCPPDKLEMNIRAGIEQYRLINAEKDILERTLNGSVRVMSEILSLANPAAFGRSLRSLKYVKHIVKSLKLPNAWRYEIAALLSQIGCVMIPPSVLEKSFRNEVLSKQEIELLNQHPMVGERLLAKIPRLEKIASMIGNQKRPFKFDRKPITEAGETQETLLGGDILKVALDFDELQMKGKSHLAALAELRRETMSCNPEVVATLATLDPNEGRMGVQSLPLKDLKIGMILQEAVRAKDNGMMLAAKGQTISSILLERLRGFARTVGVVEPIPVKT